MSEIKKWIKVVENKNIGGDDETYTDHEISMAISQLYSSLNSAIRIAKHLKDVPEDVGIEAWVASKLTTAEEYLQAVADYLDGEAVQQNKQTAMTEAEFDEAAGEKDACYHKVKARYKVFPSAYASGALVQCRKVGAKNWGDGKKE